MLSTSTKDILSIYVSNFNTLLDNLLKDLANIATSIKDLNAKKNNLESIKFIANRIDLELIESIANKIKKIL